MIGNIRTWTQCVVLYRTRFLFITIWHQAYLCCVACCILFTVSSLVVNIGCVQELNASFQLSATEAPGVWGVFCIPGSSRQRSPSGRPLWRKTAPRLYRNPGEAGQAQGKLWEKHCQPVQSWRLQDNLLTSTWATERGRNQIKVTVIKRCTRRKMCRYPNILILAKIKFYNFHNLKIL